MNSKSQEKDYLVDWYIFVLVSGHNVSMEFAESDCIECSNELILFKKESVNYDVFCFWILN